MVGKQLSLYDDSVFKKKTKIVQANSLTTRVFKTHRYSENKDIPMSAYFISPCFSIHHYNIWYVLLHHLQDLIKPYQKDCSSIDYTGDKLDITIPLKHFSLLKRKDYTFIKSRIQEVLRTSFDIEGEDEKSKKSVFVNVFSEANLVVFKKGRSSYCRFYFTRSAINLIGDMSRGYHTLNLPTAMSLKSIYSKRLYEFVSQYKNTGIFRVAESKFRKFMLLYSYNRSGKRKDMYKNIAHLKKYVLDIAVKELNTHFSSLYLKYDMKENRQGERMIFFTFSKNKLKIE